MWEEEQEVFIQNGKAKEGKRFEEAGIGLRDLSIDCYPFKENYYGVLSYDFETRENDKGLLFSNGTGMITRIETYDSEYGFGWTHDTPILDLHYCETEELRYEGVKREQNNSISMLYIDVHVRDDNAGRELQ